MRAMDWVARAEDKMASAVVPSAVATSTSVWTLVFSPASSRLIVSLFLPPASVPSSA